MLNQIIEEINNSQPLQALATIMTIIGVGLITLLTPVGRRIKEKLPYLINGYVRIYRGKGYYSENFVVNHIVKSKKTIRIICVRNSRISSPDVLRSFREFITKHNGKVELFYIDPSKKMSDDTIEKIRVTLPTPPTNATNCRQEIVSNENRMIEEIKKWDNSKRNNIALFRFRCLPSIHLCQFDNKIFLGFQFFNPKESAFLSSKTLNDLCIVINTKSQLGKLITEQIDYLRDNQSDRKEIV